MMPGKGSIGLLGVAFSLVMICCAVAMAVPGNPSLYDLDGARFGITTTGTRYTVFGGREFKYRGEWEWQITVENSDGAVTVHERGTDGEHDFAATYGNGLLVWGQATSDDAAVSSTTALCGMAFLSGKEGKIKVKGSKDVYVVPPADDYATRMTFKGKQLTEKHR